MSKTRLERSEWDMLDALLAKHGFGGYYDLVESLKLIAGRVGKKQLKKGWNSVKLDLPTVVQLLLSITKEERD